MLGERGGRKGPEGQEGRAGGDRGERQEGKGRRVGAQCMRKRIPRSRLHSLCNQAGASCVLLSHPPPFLSHLLSLTHTSPLPLPFTPTQVWLGIGDALAAAIADGKLPLLHEMYDQWPFFRGMLDLVEMVMAKADPRVTRMYDTKLVRPELQVSAG